MAKKLKNEKALLAEALRIVTDDAVRRGIVEFEPTDSHDLKVEYVYRLLVHDKEISPLPPDQLNLPKMRHRLAMWVTHKLPPDHLDRLGDRARHTDIRRESPVARIPEIQLHAPHLAVVQDERFIAVFDDQHFGRQGRDVIHTRIR
jgi:hypothetical protein